jgi:hypothetical protein
LVAFVAGPEASYITGARLTVEGGTNATLYLKNSLCRANEDTWRTPLSWIPEIQVGTRDQRVREVGTSGGVLELVSTGEIV